MKKMLLALLIATCIPQHTKAMEYVVPIAQMAAGGGTVGIALATLRDLLYYPDRYPYNKKAGLIFFLVTAISGSTSWYKGFANLPQS